MGNQLCDEIPYQHVWVGTDGNFSVNTSESSVYSYIVKIKQKQVYSIKKYTKSNRFRIGLMQEDPMPYVNPTKNVLIAFKRSFDLDNSDSYTFTSNNNENYLVIYYTGSSEQNVKVMVNYGDTILPYEKYEDSNNRYLIQGPDNTLYTLTEGALTPLADQTLTGENFLTNGLQEPPNGTWIADLPNAKVLYWQDTLSETIPKVTAALNANPPNQIILTWEADMNHESILGINSMTAEVDGFVSITLTFDHNATWWKFDGTQWAQTTQDNGMDVSTINAITTEQWANLLTLVGGSLVYRVSFVLDETSVLKRFDVDYINP